MYGNEASLLSKEKEKTPIRVEDNLLKKAIGISKCSYSTQILPRRIGITPLEYAIRKRNISFVLQLLNNPYTKRILETDAQARKQVLCSFNDEFKNSTLLEETAIRRKFHSQAQCHERRDQKG